VWDLDQPLIELSVHLEHRVTRAQHPHEQDIVNELGRCGRTMVSRSRTVIAARQNRQTCTGLDNQDGP
jgi:hypothetical protein